MTIWERVTWPATWRPSRANGRSNWVRPT